MNKKIVATYENAFREYRASTSNSNTSDRELWHQFSRRIKESFHMPISFHKCVLDVVLMMLERAEMNETVEQFKETLIASKNFMAMLRDNDFIHEKHKQHFSQSVAGYSRTKNMKMLELSIKLLRSRSIEDFDDEWNDSVNLTFSEFWEREIGNIDSKNLPILSSIYQAMMRNDRESDLPERLTSKLELVFGEVSGVDESERKINQLLERIASDRFLDNRADLIEILDREFTEMCEVLEEFFSLQIFKGMEFRVGKFGSVVNGFAMDDADMDITIMTNNYIKERYLLEMLSGFLTHRLNALDYSIQYVGNANVPVVKLVRKPRRSGDIEVHVDILVNNICGVINSTYLRTYSELRSVKYMGVLIKMWAKRVGLISQNRLSSYSFVLMMIYFLIKKNLVPNILKPIENSDYQDTPIIVKRCKQVGQQSFQIENYFDTKIDEPRYKRKFSLYEQLMGFITFYGENGEFWRGKPLICLDTQQPRELDTDMMLTIKDPFDKPHNPGRARISEKPTYMDQFHKAYERLKSKQLEKIEAMFR